MSEPDHYGARCTKTRHHKEAALSVMRAQASVNAYQETTLANLPEFEIVIEEPGYVREPVWMIGPRSYFADRAVPFVEISATPARRFDGESLRIDGKNEVRSTQSFLGRREQILRRFRSRKIPNVEEGVYYVDLRIFGLGNWSHFLNMALPLSIFIKNYVSKLGGRTSVIINEKVMRPITELLDIFSMDYISTDYSVKAPLIDIKFSNGSLSGSVIHKRARDFLAPVSGDFDLLDGRIPLNKYNKVFLNRKAPSRFLINNEEVKKFLTEIGYQELFMDEYGADEQIAIIRQASSIVAIHGAALAPLIFRELRHGPFNFIEIAPPGLVDPFFREMVASLSCKYRMVRGVPDASMVDDAYLNVESPSMIFSLKHSSRQFKIDLLSLSFALQSMDDEEFPNRLIYEAI